MLTATRSRNPSTSSNVSASSIVSRKRKFSSTDIKVIPLPSLSPKQMDQALDSLQLTSPAGCKQEDFLRLLGCSKIFLKYFQGYGGDKICAIFDKDDKFVDFKSSDDKVPGIFITCSNTKYPCCICANQITELDDEDDFNFGCQCCECGEYFHNSCCCELYET